MGELLEMLLGGKTLDATLTKGARDLRDVGARSNVRSFRVTNEGAFATTEMYPNSNELIPVGEYSSWRTKR